MEKFFNNAGPQQAANHYTLDPLQCVNLGELQDLIAQQRYFVLHAPRQTGKTTTLYALMRHKWNPCAWTRSSTSQTRRDMDLCGATHGHLVVLDTRGRTSWAMRGCCKPLAEDLPLWGCRVLDTKRQRAGVVWPQVRHNRVMGLLKRSMS